MILELDPDVFNSLDSTSKRSFASDYIYTAGVEIDTLGVVTPSDMMNGDPATELFIPVLDITTKKLSVGEITRELFFGDYAFASEETLKKVLQTIDIIIWGMYFGLSGDELESISLDDTLLGVVNSTKPVSTTNAVTSVASKTTLSTLNYNAVEAATMQLIDRNGNTTALEVKFELRNQGYRADQDEVSVMLKQVARTKELDFNTASTNGNLHLVYTK